MKSIISFTIFSAFCGVFVSGYWKTTTQTPQNCSAGCDVCQCFNQYTGYGGGLSLDGYSLSWARNSHSEEVSLEIAQSSSSESSSSSEESSEIVLPKVTCLGVLNKCQYQPVIKQLIEYFTPRATVLAMKSLPNGSFFQCYQNNLTKLVTPPWNCGAECDAHTQYANVWNATNATGGGDCATQWGKTYDTIVSSDPQTLFFEAIDDYKYCFFAANITFYQQKHVFRCVGSFCKQQMIAINEAYPQLENARRPCIPMLSF